MWPACSLRRSRLNRACTPARDLGLGCGPTRRVRLEPLEASLNCPHLLGLLKRECRLHWPRHAPSPLPSEALPHTAGLSIDLKLIATVPYCGAVDIDSDFLHKSGLQTRSFRRASSSRLHGDVSPSRAHAVGTVSAYAEGQVIAASPTSSQVAYVSMTLSCDHVKGSTPHKIREYRTRVITNTLVAHLSLALSCTYTAGRACGQILDRRSAEKNISAVSCEVAHMSIVPRQAGNLLAPPACDRPTSLR